MCDTLDDDKDEFGLVKSFDVDHGELDGLRPNECFVLGYELAVIDELLKGDESISRPIHAENRQRIEKSCNDADRCHGGRPNPQGITAFYSTRSKRGERSRLAIEEGESPVPAGNPVLLVSKRPTI